MPETTPQHPTCAQCSYDWSERFCRHGKGNKAPKNCPSLRERDALKKAQEAMQAPALRAFALQACIQESEGYGGRDQGYGDIRPVKPRILEIVEFAHRLDYSRLGLTFCMGLRKEAAAVNTLFEKAGFEVVSVGCKAGGLPKSGLGLEKKDQVDTTADFETMCNPVFQALVANESEVQLNVLLGLCVGHDSMFIQHAEAPVTVLAVKDRLLGHNPLAAVNQMDAYYRYLKNPNSLKPQS